MKKVNYLLLFIPLLLTSCNQKEDISSSDVIDSTSTTETSSSEDITSTTESSSSSTSSVDSEEDWTNSRELLECGYYEMDLPKNYNNPLSIKADTSSTTWNNYSLKETLPSDFRYIYKNACDDGPKYHKTNPSFYSVNNNAPGGLKVTEKGVGVQSNMFNHDGEKLEIRIGISQVNNATDKPVENKDTMHIYYFNKNGDKLGYSTISEGSITVSSAGNYIKVYLTESYTKDVCYFDIRLNEKPYKGSQCYNFGIDYINYKSWLYA